MGIAILIAAIITAAVLQLIAERRGFSGIRAEIRPDVDEQEPGKSFYLTLRIENTTRTLYPFVRFLIPLPDDLEIVSPLTTESHGTGTQRAIGTLLLKPREVYTRQIEVKCSRRGLFRFGDVMIETGDFLGLKEYRESFDGFRRIAIYPKTVETADLSPELGGFLGDVSIRRYLYEDPVLVSGFREYTGREPMKTISWMQSAKSGKLMVSQFDHTAEPFVTVVLDTSGLMDAEAEKCFSAARAVCEQLETQRIEYDFYLNAVLYGDAAQQNYMARGLGSRHLCGILRGLASAGYGCTISGAGMISEVLHCAGGAPGIIYITYRDRGGSENATVQSRDIPALFKEASAGSVFTVYAEELPW